MNPSSMSPHAEGRAHPRTPPQGLVPIHASRQPRPALSALTRQPVLHVHGLRVDYPKLVAVRDLDLMLQPGDALALIGPNGAGKTSTMRAIAGLLEPTLGAITVNGVTLESDPMAYRRAVGFMPDDAPVYERLTAREFLEHYGLAYGVRDLESRIDHCLAMTELRGKADTPCKGLSRGMRQRLLLARTVLPDPKLLLLDEPASGLDPMARRGFRSLIRQLRDQGKALIVSSHILSEIDEYCTHALVLERGLTRLSGPISALAERAASATHRRMKVAWRPGDAHAHELLSRDPHVQDLVAQHTDAVTFVFTGGDDALDDLLARLISSQVRIREWTSSESTLEHILLSSGARDLQ